MPLRAPLRAFVVLLGVAVLASTGFLLVITVTPVLSARYLPGSVWIGVPSALITLGMALGTPLISRMIPRLGRPAAFGLGLGVAAAAALVPAFAAWRGAPFLVYVGGAVLLGAGYAAYHLIRFAAALLFPPRRQGRAIGFVVWMAAVSSFAGPVLLGGIGRLAGSSGNASIPLAYLAAALLFGACAVILFRSRSLRRVRALRARPRPAFRPPRPALPPPGPATASGPSAPGLAAAVVAMVGAQAAMMLMMTMTPVVVMGRGGSLDALAVIMGGHVFGMFGLAPVVGWLCDRLGPAIVVLGGGAAVVTAGLLGALTPGVGVSLGVALALLGLGWSLAFVAASTVLARGGDPAGKLVRQRRADSLNWAVAASGSAASGVLMAAVGYSGVAWTAAAVGLLPLGAGTLLWSARIRPAGLAGLRGSATR